MTTTNQQGMIAKKANNSVAKKTNLTIKDYIKLYEEEIAKALPTVMTPERFTRIALSAVGNTPKLAVCTRQSFLGAMMNAAQLGLEPNTPLGQAYLIPYENRKKGITECQFQIGYKGLLDLAYRSGEVSMVDAQVVYENDKFDYELGLNPILKHKPSMANRGNPISYYAIVKLKNGGYSFQVMSYNDVKKHAEKYSKTYSNGPWQTNFDEMAKKTVLKKALKYAPLKTDFVRAVSEDETIKESVSNDMSEVPNEFYEAEYEEQDINDNTDPVTGEVK